MPRSRIPNFLSLGRLLGAPLLLPAALVGRASFLGLLGLLLVSDGLDGYLARRLRALTPRGALLDSIADHVTSICAFGGIWHLWPGPLRAESGYVVLLASAYIVPVIYSVARYGRVFAYHTHLSRIAGALAALALLPFLAGWTAIPLRLAAITELLVALEYFSISVILPSHWAPVSSLLEARRLAGAPRRSVDPAENPS